MFSPIQWKVGIRVKVTFYFSGHSDIRGWQGTPPPPQEMEIGLKMNAIEKMISSEVSKCILQSNPTFLPSHTLSYFMPEQETCEFQFQIDI